MRAIGAVVALVACAAGRNAILGLDPGEPADVASGTGAAGAASSATAGGQPIGGGGASSAGGTSSSGASDRGGSASVGGMGGGGTGGDGGAGGASPCTGCGPGETCNAQTLLCECGNDGAAAPGDEACPDDDQYRACVNDANGARCGCETGSCTGQFVCDDQSFECLCEGSAACLEGFCSLQGGLAGHCFTDGGCPAGAVVINGICTCDDVAASCED